MKFINNIANVGGGAIFATRNSHVTIKDNSNVSFSDNVAQTAGGAINVYINCELKIIGNSYVTFTNNSAGDGYKFRNTNAVFLPTEFSKDNSAFKCINAGTTAASVNDPNVTNFKDSFMVVCNNKIT